MRFTLIGAMGLALLALSALAVSSAATPAAAPSGSASAPVLHSAPAPTATALAPRHRPTVVEHYVDLNSASRAELMTLPGVGAAEAERIIAGRPYLSKTELVTKSLLPVGPFLSVKNLVVAMPKAAARGKK